MGLRGGQEQVRAGDVVDLGPGPVVGDIARAYLFLASPQAHLVSGAAIPV